MPTTTRFERFLPIAGVLAGLLFAAAMLLTGPMPSGTDDPAGRMKWLADHQGLGQLAAAAGAYFCVAMLFFTTGVRRALRSGEANESTYSTAAFAGGILVAVSIAISAVVTFTATAAAHKHNLEVSTVMGFLDDSTWVPWVAGSAVLFLSTGLGGLRTAALPKWLSIVTIVLGVLCLLGPTGVAVFFVTPLWLIVTGVVLARHQSTTIALPAETATPSYA